MPKVIIQDKGCRGCTMCVDICPVDIFEMKEDLAIVVRQDDCIGCLSCHYVCPSQAVFVQEIELLRPFHRIEENVALIEKMLEAPTAAKSLTTADIDEALKDIGGRLLALAQAVTEGMGRADRAVGRRAGILAAEHLPEMYEETTLEGVLGRMQRRMKNSFDFDFRIEDTGAQLTFHPCGLYDLMVDAGETVGDCVLCRLFHEYWAGLLSRFTGTRFACEVPSVGKTCVMSLKPHRHS